MRNIITALIALTAAIMIILLLPLSASRPSAFEEDRSGDDLSELESMMSGEQTGTSYGPEEADLYLSPVPAQAFPGLDYAPPYSSIFQNDTYFGDFIRQLYGAAPANETQTWSETLQNGTLHLSITGKKNAGSRTHFIKPILIEEPDF